MHRIARVSVGTLVCCAVLIGCGQGASVDTSAYSDRQIFEGVVFGAGPVASLVPEARNHLAPELYARSADELSAMADARATVVDAIESAHPGFLSEFARAARSGDPAKVQAMLVRATGAITEAAASRSIGVAPNVPATREPNVPLALRDPNVPATREPNVPLESVRLQPAWELLTSRLFSEQLASSVATVLGRGDGR